MGLKRDLLTLLGLFTVVMLWVILTPAQVEKGNFTDTSHENAPLKAEKYEPPPTTPTPTPTSTPTPTPTPTVIPLPPPIKIDPNTVDFVLFYYAENVTPADEYAFKLVKEISKYVNNVTYCEFNTSIHSILNTTPSGREEFCFNEILHYRINIHHKIGDPLICTPSLLIHYKNGRYEYYHGISREYLVPNSINWFYAKITGNTTLPSVAKAPLEELAFYALTDPAYCIPPPPDPNHIPKPIEPLNPNDIEMIIFATNYMGPAFDEMDAKALNLTKQALEYAPHAKFVKLTDYSWFDQGVKSDPPGYENYWNKYVIPYAKYKGTDGYWYLAMPSVIVVLKNGSVRTYSDVWSYKDYCELVENMGYDSAPYLIYPPIEKLILDIQAYLNQTKKS